MWKQLKKIKKRQLLYRQRSMHKLFSHRVPKFHISFLLKLNRFSQHSQYNQYNQHNQHSSFSQYNQHTLLYIHFL